MYPSVENLLLEDLLDLSHFLLDLTREPFGCTFRLQIRVAGDLA